jgi:hypothetical protein
LLSSRLGESDRAESYARELERLVVPPGGRNVVPGLAATIRADVAMSKGRAADALHFLSTVNGAVPLELVYTKAFTPIREFSQEHARYLRAEALLASGRNDDARRWFESSFQGSPMELAYLAPMHARLGQLMDRAGSPADAVTHLRVFVTLWGQCDPPLQPRVAEASALLKRLQTQ